MFFRGEDGWWALGALTLYQHAMNLLGCFAFQRREKPRGCGVALTLGMLVDLHLHEIFGPLLRVDFCGGRSGCLSLGMPHLSVPASAVNALLPICTN